MIHAEGYYLKSKKLTKNPKIAKITNAIAISAKKVIPDFSSDFKVTTSIFRDPAAFGGIAKRLNKHTLGSAEGQAWSGAEPHKPIRTIGTDSTNPLRGLSFEFDLHSIEYHLAKQVSSAKTVPIANSAKLQVFHMAVVLRRTELERLSAFRARNLNIGTGLAFPLEGFRNLHRMTPLARTT